MLRPPEVHIRTIHFNVNARFVYDMHAMHVVLKNSACLCLFYCELAVVQS